MLYLSYFLTIYIQFYKVPLFNLIQIKTIGGTIKKN